MRRFLEAVFIVVVTLGWWGFIYPELSMVTESSVQETEAEAQEAEAKTQEAEAKMQDESAQTPGEKSFRGEEAASSVKIGEKLGSAGVVSGNLRIKSRLAEYLYQGKEKDKIEKESDYEQPKRTHRGV